MVKLSTTICWLAFAPVLGRELRSEVAAVPKLVYEKLGALMVPEGKNTPVVAFAIVCPGDTVYLLTKDWPAYENETLVDNSVEALESALFLDGVYSWTGWADHNKISIAGSDGKERIILNEVSSPFDTGFALKVEDGSSTEFHNFEPTVQKLDFVAFVNEKRWELIVSAYTLKLDTCPSANDLEGIGLPLVVELAPFQNGKIQKAVVTTAESALFSADESWGPVEYILISVFVGVPLCCCLLFVVCKAISKKKDQDRSRKEEQEAEQNSSPRMQRPRVNRPHAGNRQ